VNCWSTNAARREGKDGPALHKMKTNNIYVPFSHLTSTDRQALMRGGLPCLFKRFRAREHEVKQRAWEREVKKGTKKAKALSAKEKYANLRFPSLCHITLDPIPEPKPRSCPGSPEFKSYPGSSFLQSWLSCPGCLAPPVLPWLSCTGCPFLADLS
jgi:hypothetical protein